MIRIANIVEACQSWAITMSLIIYQIFDLTTWPLQIKAHENNKYRMMYSALPLIKRSFIECRSNYYLLSPTRLPVHYFTCGSCVTTPEAASYIHPYSIIKLTHPLMNNSQFLLYSHFFQTIALYARVALGYNFMGRYPIGLVCLVPRNNFDNCLSFVSKSG